MVVKMAFTVDTFCGSQFWDLQVTWNTTDPDFTPCFQKTALTFFPLLFLLLVAPIRLFGLLSLKNRPILWNVFNISKLVICGLIAAVMFVKCVASFIGHLQNLSVAPVNFVSPFVVLIGMICVGYLVCLERRKGIRTSGYLVIFWLLFVLCSIIIFCSKVKNALLQGGVTEVLDFTAFVFYFLLTIASCILSTLVDGRTQFDSVDDAITMYPVDQAPPNLTILCIPSTWRRLIIKGYKHSLVRGELWSLNTEDTCAAVKQLFLKHWNAQSCKMARPLQALTDYSSPSSVVTYKDNTVFTEVKVVDGSEHRKPSLLKTLVLSFIDMFCIAFFLKLLHDTLLFISPLLLKYLIRFITDRDEFVWHGYLYAGAMLLVALAQSLVLHQYFHTNVLLGMRLRSVIISAVYRKTLVMSNSARKSSTVGEIVNLMSVDAQRFMDLMTYLHTIWSGPFQIIVSVIMLWQILGPSVLAGIAVMVVLIPINAVIALKIRRLQVKQMTLKDSRMKIMNEVLNGIKVLKLYAWEKSFQEKILTIRNHELEMLKKAAYLNAFSSFFWTCAPFLVSLTTFAVYTMVDINNVLDAEKAFVSISLFNIMRFPLSMLPNVITNIVQASVSLDRLQKFLDNDELDSEAVQHCLLSKSAIKISDGTFMWDKHNSETLKNINLEVDEGSLIAVVGSVGAGKSSLLSAILGEMDKTSGTVNVKGSVAYVAQQAWIQNATLRDNILFSGEFLDSRYHDVVDACALQQDLDMLQAGDHTEIGEKGINLSGGQKQRVSLARAVYCDSDVYLLDDPLSSVDSHVGKHIFENVIGPKGILKDKTRVLVTHGIGFLSAVDKIIVMKNGEILEMGSFCQLMDHNGAFADFLRNYISEEIIQDDPTINKDADALCLRDDIISHLGTVGGGADNSGSGTTLLKRQISRLSAHIHSNPNMDPTGSHMSLASLGKESHKYLEKSVSSQVQTLPAEAVATEKDKLIQVESVQTGRVKFSVFLMYLKAIGCLLTCAIVLFYVLYNALSIYANVWLSQWSDDASDPSLAKDTKHRNMRLGVYGALGALQDILSVWYCVQRFYVASSRQLKRLESTSRSPIYSHFGETITGASVIRAFRQQDHFIHRSETCVDENQVCYFPSIVSNRWLAVRLEFVGNCIIFFACMFAVLGRDDLSPGIVGLSISYAMNMTQTLNWMVRMTCELEANIVSVERVKEYTETETEAEWEIPETKPDSSWPQHGVVRFHNYQTRYRDGLDLALQGINCDINAGEKIGIVGRTGAGKSSLTLALFRIIESAGGDITVDGIPISTIGLHDLRSKLTIIPQDSVVFSGSLRMNLDPFDNHSDEDLWQALEHAHLKAYVQSLPAGLQHECSEGGENLSVGQRQLLCLARALIRRTKVLILDEATAAVDMETDDLIQSTIRREFSDCTVLTIAHRLNTIMDYSRILVLDAGKVVEFSSPHTLLQDSDSIFYMMAKDAGLV